MHNLKSNFYSYYFFLGHLRCDNEVLFYSPSNGKKATKPDSVSGFVALMLCHTMLFLGKGTETGSQNLGALHDVDKRMRVDVIERRTQLDHI